jgi:hypothetical protein
MVAQRDLGLAAWADESRTAVRREEFRRVAVHLSLKISERRRQAAKLSALADTRLGIRSCSAISMTSRGVASSGARGPRRSLPKPVTAPIPLVVEPTDGRCHLLP